MAFDTAGQIIADAMTELGLSAVSDPFTSDDPNATQMCTFLKSLGRDLLGEHKWTILRKEYSFTTVLNTPTYTLPADFYGMYDQSGWNRTNRLPLGGPLDAQEWQYLKARLVNVVFTVLFRPMAGSIYIYPDTNTPGGYNIAFEYRSNGWVRVPALPSDTYQDYPSDAAHIIQYESNLVSRGLKLKWLKAHGFDTVSAQQDYNDALMKAKGNDSFTPILSLTRPGALRGVDQMIGQQSVPITGFGT